MDDRPCADTEFADRSLVLEFARQSLGCQQEFVEMVAAAGPEALVEVIGALCREMRRRATAHEDLAEVIAQVLPGSN
jgi:hypothetical protein